MSKEEKHAFAAIARLSVTQLDAKKNNVATREKYTMCEAMEVKSWRKAVSGSEVISFFRFLFTR